MKKRITSCLNALVLFGLLTGVLPILSAQTTAIPDANFEKALIDLNYDTGTPDGSVPTANISSIKNLDVTGKDIADLTGIQDFTSLNFLTVSQNKLTALDLTSNTRLIAFSCDANRLTSLKIPQTSVLQGIYCQENKLQQLNLSGLPNLRVLHCYNNELTGLDIQNNTRLEYLRAYDNKISGTVDLSKTNRLAEVSISNNRISQLLTIQQSNNTLKNLWCANNQIKSIDVSNYLALEDLFLDDNDLSTLDVSKNTELIQLAAGINNLSHLDLSNNTKLQILGCYDNQLLTLDVSKNTALQRLFCYNNKLQQLDVSNNTQLYRFWLYANELTKLDVSKNTLLEDFIPGANNIDSLDLSKNTKLKSVDVRSSPKLVYLDLRNGNNHNILEYRSQRTPLLSCIFVDNVAYSQGNWTDVDPASNFVLNQGECSAILAVEDHEIEGLQLFPNPVRDLLTISTNSNTVIQEVSVFDYTGRKVRNINWKGKTARLNQLAPGVYILKVQTNMGATARKIIKI